MAQRPYTKIERGTLLPTREQVSFLAGVIDLHPRGLIICGPRCPTTDFPIAVAQLAAAAGYPILADPLSGVRFGSQISMAPILGGYETFLQSSQTSRSEPDLILRFGAVPTSRWLNTYLNRIVPAHHIHIQDNGIWADQDHLTSLFLHVNSVEMCRQLISKVTRSTDSNWINQWVESESLNWNTSAAAMAETLFDGSVVAALLDQLPPDSMLFVGNSLAIRHVDQFGRPQEKPLQLFANRGASGIDGNVSTGLGIAAASNRHTVLLIGDITFYHDSNGLLALYQLGLDNVTIVLINNNGGGIFRRLPVAQIEPPFEELFLTPHGLDFAPLAAMYGLDYHLAQDLDSFRSMLEKSISTKPASIIEIQTDSQKDDLIRQTIISQVKTQLETEYGGGK